jgi:glutathione S-transferase
MSPRTAQIVAVTVWGRGQCTFSMGVTSPVRRSQWVLEEGRIEYELRKIDILKGEHQTAEFLAINPAGLIPVLITPEGDALYEVAALMVYLADRHQLSELAPAMTDPRRGLFLSTIFYIASDIQSEMKRFHFPHRYSLRREDDIAIQDLTRTLVISRLDIVNTRLAKGGPYVLGPRFCLADFYLSFGSPCSTPTACASGFHPLPSCMIWFDLVRAPSPILRGRKTWRRNMLF